MADGPDTNRFLVLGCGHTGTTLISGLLHINGYGSFKVSRLFENTDLNSINQRILSGAQVDEAEIRRFIAKVEKKTGGKWSLKDPRLSETVLHFYEYIPRPVKIIFNYRDPCPTVESLIKERELHESHLSPVEMLQRAEAEWLVRNRAALGFLDNDNQSPLLITRYDDLVDRKLDDILCRFVGHALDLSFIDSRKRRSSGVPVSQELVDVYHELNRRFEVNSAEIFETTKPVRLRFARRPTLRTRLYVQSNRLIRRDLIERLMRRSRRAVGARGKFAIFRRQRDQ
jgi:hypothetical protein